MFRHSDAIKLPSFSSTGSIDTEVCLVFFLEMEEIIRDQIR